MNASRPRPEKQAPLRVSVGTGAEPRVPEAVPLEAIQEAVAGVRFGVVQLIIQDGRVVQIDRTEKIRLV